jgi:hypothetical protein
MDDRWTPDPERHRRDPWDEYVDERWRRPPHRPHADSYERGSRGQRIIHVGRGDSLIFLVQALVVPLANLDVPPMPADITLWTIWFSAKHQLPDPDLASAIQVNTTPYTTVPGAAITLPDPTNGFAQVSVPGIFARGYPDGEVRLVFDVRGVDPTGNTYTIDLGEIWVVPRATRFF